MVEKTLVVAVNPGLQAGIASEFVQKANSYVSEIFLEKANRRVNAKSIMGLLSLAITNGDSITLLSDGDDDQEAIEVLANFLSNPS